MFPTGLSWWRWSWEAALPSPVPQSGYKKPDAEKGVPDVYRHIPSKNMYHWVDGRRFFYQWWIVMQAETRLHYVYLYGCQEQKKRYNCHVQRCNLDFSCCWMGTELWLIGYAPWRVSHIKFGVERLQTNFPSYIDPLNGIFQTTGWRADSLFYKKEELHLNMAYSKCITCTKIMNILINERFYKEILRKQTISVLGIYWISI